MKKKVLSLLLVFVLCLTACGGGDPLDAIKGANGDQKAVIHDILNDCDITVKSCSEATMDSTGDEAADALLTTMLTNFVPYDITAEDGAVYRMVIKKEDYSVFTITNPEGETVYGGLSGFWN